MSQVVTIICGTEQLNARPLPPYSDVACAFLDDFASALREDAEAKRYPDVMTFAFWARKGSIGKRREEYNHQQNGRVRLGKGVIFHIAPANVPVNSMFTYAFGLLAGNANIVRIPSKEFPQVICMCRVLKQVLAKEEYLPIFERTLIVRYDRTMTEPTKRYSVLCDMRVIWGGDETIRAIRKAELPPRSIEITFSDRYSFGIIDVRSVLAASEQELKTLAEHFYNDTYLMDQNACSAPHLICWSVFQGSREQDNNAVEDEISRIKEAKSRFWDAVYDVAKKYELADIMVSEKYTMLCEQAALSELVTEVIRRENLLYRCELSGIPADVMTACRGRYGLFYECEIDSFDTLEQLSDARVQTCAVYGVDVVGLRRYIVEHGYRGIDRVVPFGKTLDIDTVWDGYDLISTMSRVVAGI